MKINDILKTSKYEICYPAENEDVTKKLGIRMFNDYLNSYQEKMSLGIAKEGNEMTID